MTQIGQEITRAAWRPTARIPAAGSRRSAHVIDLRTSADAAKRVQSRTSFGEVLAVPAAMVAAPATAAPAKPGRAVSRKSKAKPRRALSVRRLLGHVFRALIFLAGSAGFLLLNVSLAVRLIGIYFIAVLVYAIDSQRSFLVALIFLVMVAVWSGMGDTAAAGNYAVYAFCFLAIGLFSAVREMWRRQPSVRS